MLSHQTVKDHFLYKSEVQDHPQLHLDMAQICARCLSRNIVLDPDIPWYDQAQTKSEFDEVMTVAASSSDSGRASDRSYFYFWERHKTVPEESVRASPLYVG